jgi:hypothetical protein
VDAAVQGAGVIKNRGSYSSSADAHCTSPSCEWTYSGGDGPQGLANMRRQARRHVKKTGHPVGTESTKVDQIYQVHHKGSE